MTDKSSRGKLAYAFAALSLGLLLFASAIAAGLNTGVANAQAATSSQDTQQDAASRVAQNKEYLTKFRTALERMNAETDPTEIAKLENEINELEKLNKKLFEMDSQLLERYYDAERQLIAKYQDVNSTTYVGDNPVAVIFPDLLRRTVVVIVDPERLAETGPIQIEDQINGIPVTVVETPVEDTSCVNNSRLEECRPLLGGIAIREQGQIGTGLDTLGYKATYNGNIGFVLAGHSAVANLKYIIQPNDENKVVGQVQRFCKVSGECDFAWARAATGIDINHYICPGATPPTCVSPAMTVGTKTSGANQLAGTFVIKSGAKTAETEGYLLAGTGNSRVAKIFTDGGDSGSPIYKKYSCSTGCKADLYGLIVSRFLYNGEWHARYYVQDYIETKIGAIAVTGG